MKTLLSTTALVVALGFPAVTFAQTATTETTRTASQQTGEMRGFLANRNQSDVFASDLMGHDVYARRNAAGTTAASGQAKADKVNTNKANTNTAASGQATMNSNGLRNMQSMNRADLDQMDNIGQINEIVLSSDGKVRALVIGVGGFLGMGEHDVAVTMDQVTFASDAEDRSEMHIVVNTDAKMLKGSPAYDRTATATDRTQVGAESGRERSAFTAPNVSRDGYDRVKVKEVSAEMLNGKSVYGVNEKSVGTIDDLILDDKGAISNVIIDFGGFLGIGTSQVSVGFDDLTILANEGRKDVRVYIDATKEQIQAQPQYRAAKRASN